MASLDTDRPEAVFRPRRVLEVGDSRGRPLGRQVTVERSRAFRDGVLLKLEGLAGRTEALEALRGHTLLIPAAEAAPAAPGEIHFRSLLGLSVLDGAEPLGMVERIVETAGGELIGVRRPGGRELLLPFVGEWLQEVDLERGELRFVLPEGLRDL